MAALGASSLSVSRWERDSDTLRTLINVGDLQPGDQRWPDHDIYPIADDPYVADLLQHGRPYVHAIDDPTITPADLDYLRRAGKESGSRRTGDVRRHHVGGDLGHRHCGPALRP